MQVSIQVRLAQVILPIGIQKIIKISNQPHGKIYLLIRPSSFIRGSPSESIQIFIQISDSVEPIQRGKTFNPQCMHYQSDLSIDKEQKT